MPVEYLNLMTGYNAGWFNQKYIVRIKSGNQTIREIPTNYSCENSQGNANAAIQSVLPELGRDGWELVSLNFGKADGEYCIARATLTRKT